MSNKFFDVSFRCYYPNNNFTDHYQYISIDDIPKWIECYKFTHPNCVSITVKLWFSDSDQNT